MSDLVSIIVPAYNPSHLLIDALNSALNQSYKEIEIIVIDDGSDFEVREFVLGHLNDSRINVQRQHQKGPAGARNLGIKCAAGKYFAFLDSDDLWAPSKLEKQMLLFERKPEVALVHTGLCIFRKDRNYPIELRTDYSKYNKIERYLRILTSSVSVKKEAVLRVDGFDEDLIWAEDVDFYFRVANHYEVDYIPEPLTYYRIHSGSWGATEQRVHHLIKCEIDALKKAKLLPKFSDSISLINERIAAYYEGYADSFNMQLRLSRTLQYYILSLRELPGTELHRRSFIIWKAVKATIKKFLSFIPMCRRFHPSLRKYLNSLPLFVHKQIDVDMMFKLLSELGICLLCAALI